MKDYVNVQPKNTETKTSWLRSNGMFALIFLVGVYTSFNYGNW
ncbi:hypothetical protein FDJ25_gp070 [Vibrio phage Aphrodite1]|uniref:Uncharacterized protein n=3 Tax=Aphroditevirus TaxID=2560092 RepID=A0A2I7QI81_9CAUD|nr:hypothetical protein FDJ25_gp070 [Vibrio phage Aphrodite1]YP_009847858.1 hypothetical protein HWC35_gp122 [Vibrio phage USC-1]AUR81104.1 hypothetical protein Aphrodite1_0133 [Vibrio phage Aphrodite1]QCW23212.1 hypothetical protein [Vibrio phage 5 TSL-2019]QDH47516.1 hypothetical protein [Vibrio phage USC-1]